MSVEHHHYPAVSRILIGLALIMFVLGAFGVGLGVNMVAIGLAFFAAAHLI